MGEDKLDEEIQPDKEGKFPEVVPWNKYVGIKESLGKKLDTERQKVASLEEQLKMAIKPEDVKSIKDELDETKTKLTTTETELSGLKQTTLTEKRSILTKRGIPEESVKDMSVKELDAAILATKYIKPGSDMGGGGGSGSLPEDPMTLFRMAKTKTR